MPKQTAIDLQVVVEYGVGKREVAAEVRQNVIAAVERMTGLEVVEVNIAVNDVHLPDDDPPQTSEDRVLWSRDGQEQVLRPIAPARHRESHRLQAAIPIRAQLCPAGG